MASKVNPKPTLTGADAKRFIQKLNTPSTDEEIKAFKELEVLLKKSISKDFFFWLFLFKTY